jgi:osmoprotectant transport system permease protein
VVATGGADLMTVGLPIEGFFAQAAVPRDVGVFEFLFSAQYWTGDGGILTSLWDTVTLSAVVVVVASLIGVPLAMILAHMGKGELTVTWGVTLSRAIPTFAIAGLLVPISLRNGWGFEPWPIFLALLLLALPPIYLNTYTAVREVDRGAVDAARAMGFSERSVLFRVEMALATAVIFTGIRVAAVTVVATEPIRAFLGGDGIGRYVRDGLGQNNDNLLLAGAILVAALAGLTGFAFSLAQRFALPPGVRRLALGRNR